MKGIVHLILQAKVGGFSHRVDLPRCQSPPLMSSSRHNLETYGRWHATILPCAREVGSQAKTISSSSQANACAKNFSTSHFNDLYMVLVNALAKINYQNTPMWWTWHVTMLVLYRRKAIELSFPMIACWIR